MEAAIIMNNGKLETICVYCGSADHIHPDYLQAAYEMGACLAHRGIRLVYGAGKTGLMGAVANGALQAGGTVLGVLCENLNLPELIHTGLTGLELVPTIQQRKARMSELAQAFIALPGGFGTFDELFETLTWAQIGLHTKPIGLLDTRGYFQPLLKMVEHALQEGFIYPEHAQLIAHAAQPTDLLAALEAYQQPTGLERWLTRDSEEKSEPMFWQRFTAAHPEMAGRGHTAWSFGNTPEMADRLGMLVVQGVKTATTSLIWSFEQEGEALPRPGDLSLILDGQKRPLCVIETLEANVRAFDEVDDRFAFDEGEGDRSLDYWRRVHWEFFSGECTALGRQPYGQMPVVCERFRVVYCEADS